MMTYVEKEPVLKKRLTQKHKGGRRFLRRALMRCDLEFYKATLQKISEGLIQEFGEG